MNHSNSTSFDAFSGLEIYRRGYVFQICGSLTIVLIALAAFFGNLAVIVVSFREEKIRSQTGNFLIVLLSSIDVVTSIFVIIPSGISMAVDFWPLGTFGCRINAIFNYSCACASSHTASMISLDRALAIVYPLKYQAMMTLKTMFYIFGWIFCNASFCVILTVAMLYYSITYDYNEALCAGVFSEYITKIYINTAAASCFMIPAVIIATCNFVIVRQIRKSTKVMPQQIFSVRAVNFEQNSRRKKDMEMRKSVYSMMVVIIVYFICFAPYTFTKQGKVISDIDAPPWLNFVATVMMFVCSATNPFIYGILRKDYRDGFKKIARLLKEKFYNCCT